jgi:exopolyphosphatase / guanosine-5'-triphosphate,3'-diphosphate pyrophosphatase
MAPGSGPDGAMRLAAVDVGTNSTRLLVADVAGERVIGEHARKMVITRLGKGVDRTGRLDPDALARTLEVLAGYAELCGRLGAGAIRAVATSATRDAANREEFLGGLRDLLGVDAEVLAGDQEAAISYAGATHDLPGEQRTLVIDIGGGSTEFIIGNHQPEAMRSIDIGCVRLFERHLSSDPPTPDEVAALREDVRGQLGKVREVLDPGSAERVVGVAGTVTTVTALALGLEVYDPERIHLATVDAETIHQTAQRLVAMTIEERAALPLMAKGREDVIAAGALVLDEICRTFGFQRVTASERDILDGVLLGLARRLSPAGWRPPA